MSLSTLLINIIDNPDNIDYFIELKRFVDSKSSEWFYRGTNHLSLSSQFLEFISNRYNKEIDTRITKTKTISNIIKFDSAVEVYLSLCHFGIKSIKGWEDVHIINSPQLITHKTKTLEKVRLKKAIVICEQAASNYAHFQVRTMIRLNQVIEQVPNTKDWTIVIDDDLTGFRKELIEIHPKFRNLNYVSARFKHLIIEDCIVHKARKPELEKEISLLYDLWNNIEINSYNNLPKRIYIERKTSKNGSQNRKVVNIEQRNEWLKRNNFTVVTMEELTVEQEIYMFKHAEIVVGVEGAALINVIHMQPKTVVVELHHNNRRERLFQNIGKFKDINYIKLACNSPYTSRVEKSLELTRNIHTYQLPLICDFNKLQSILDEIV